jgi:hypothetical protein
LRLGAPAVTQPRCDLLARVIRRKAKFRGATLAHHVEHTRDEFAICGTRFVSAHGFREPGFHRPRTRRFYKNDQLFGIIHAEIQAAAAGQRKLGEFSPLTRQIRAESQTADL